MPGKGSFWRDRNVLVTGCTGFLGSWVAEELVKAGANVVGLVRDGVPRSRLVEEGILNRITAVWGDVEDYRLLERTLGEYEVASVFHLAAQTIVGIANRNPLSTLETNVRGTWNLLEACRRSSTLGQIAIASSDKAYGSQETLPYDEGMPLQGFYPYDVSKSCADLLAAAYFHTYGLPVCITRFGNFYGGGDLNFNRIVPQTMRSIIRNEAPVVRSDGSYVRDYIYIEDAAKAYLLLAERMSDDPSLRGEAFNFSCESPLTVIELVEKILLVMGRQDLTPRILNECPHEIHRQYLSAKKARERLGWRPVFSLEEGLWRTMNWYREFFRVEVSTQ